MDIQAELTSVLSADRVHARLIDRVAYATDASYFRLVPQAVVQPVSTEEIKALFRFSQLHRIPLVFRAAGTSLSGQAVTDGILVDLSKHWVRYGIEQDGKRVKFQPGIVGGFLNNVLKAYHRRLGPDPASIDSAMMGGILANNSSGMCCGVIENSYRTVDSMTVVLPDGCLLDTSRPDAADQLHQGAPHIARGLLELKSRLLSSPADDRHRGETLADRVRRRYQMKNNNGYLLNAFLDFDDPLDILTHLMIGSEGTLGFIAEATLNTLPDFSRKLTGLFYFKNIQDAASAIFPLKQSGVRAAEIMDRASLRSIENLPGSPPILAQLPEAAAGILVEYQAETTEEMAAFKKSCAAALSEIKLLEASKDFEGSDHGLTDDPVLQAALWKLRKGIIPSVGAMRAPRTTLLTEDVVFPVPQLADAITDLQHLFTEHGYAEGVIFGHAKDGNLHFLIAQAFDTEREILRFKGFMKALVDLVSGKYDGALKAEHGTGRNMAPFVETEWGTTGYGIMRDLKALFDPDGMLAPGVIINEDPEAYVADLKNIYPVASEVDQCIECGFCESKCPSRWLTLTPRQRIVVQREIARLRSLDPNSPGLGSLVEDYAYDGIETCAVDGLCATTCPVGINTGELTKKLRAESVSPGGKRVAEWVANHFSFVENSMGGAVQIAHAAEKVVGAEGLTQLTMIASKIAGPSLPKWNGSIPHLPHRRPPSPAQKDFIYFPSCISRQLGLPPTRGEPGRMALADALMTIAGRAGVRLFIPQDVQGVCCGMPFSSKGYLAAYQATLHNALQSFWIWSEHGKIPLVIDTTSCTYALRTCADNPPALADRISPEDLAIYRHLTVLDSVELIHDTLLSRLDLHPIDEDIVLHPNCSARKLGLDTKLHSIASKCARSATVPMSLGCCAFAGDRGLMYPELTRSATRVEASEVRDREYAGHYSSNITCEIGLSSATGHTYKGIAFLVETASR